MYSAHRRQGHEGLLVNVARCRLPGIGDQLRGGEPVADGGLDLSSLHASPESIKDGVGECQLNGGLLDDGLEGSVSSADRAWATACTAAALTGM